ncbi:ZIP family metal transporter [Shewanella sp. OMA3-2]|uniref:ZIP family metal transporter n=1 Tax=Shewanella sp. OMA3-2 TaxID=2908650 RepID=UPI001F158B90|nr:divalent cation transporter [Shewanella sp. OMA3-2]UJF21520.1 divalent cation transporter [Shewanella sp. OMA3-2]
MSEVLIVIFATLIAGLAMPLGAVIAKMEHIKSDWLQQEFRHGVMAFGGGALLSAVGLVLVPESVEVLSLPSAVMFFGLGALAFMLLDILLVKINTPASQLSAMLADFIPESIALGAAFATGSHTAFLLAVLIGLQNLPEGFNAYRELNQHNRFKPWLLIGMFALMALFGPIAGVVGYVWLAPQPEVIGAIMIFAAGGILYSVFQDIAPQVKLAQHWLPPCGAVLGFGLGMVGYMLVQ